jgi:SAM-dependent methyltransferase
MRDFHDHFSAKARDYAQYRPRYPADLFVYLASLSPGQRLAWDCGTGNGQAAHALAGHFERVIATDPSAEQVAHAVAHERIEYRVERAEDVSLPDGSVDLVTAGIAIHWFNFEQFYAAVQRVLAPRGIIAVWTYHLPDIEPEIDRILKYYYSDVLAGYWPERIRYIDERYRTLPFPFHELHPPEFAMKTQWDLDHILGFLDSWSGTQAYQRKYGQDPVKLILRDLNDAWGEQGQLRTLNWPLFLRVGRIE